MIVIADTTPLNYPILIENVDVLASLYNRIVIPETVASELRRNPAPAPVKAWIAQPPLTLEFLDPGERAALSLAEDLCAAEILIDDWAGREEAERRHLYVAGTLGGLSDAHLAGVERLVRQRLALHTKQP